MEEAEGGGLEQMSRAFLHPAWPGVGERGEIDRRPIQLLGQSLGHFNQALLRSNQSIDQGSRG